MLRCTLLRIIIITSTKNVNSSFFRTIIRFLGLFRNLCNYIIKV
jgi:hypothetical protein